MSRFSTSPRASMTFALGVLVFAAGPMVGCQSAASPEKPASHQHEEHQHASEAQGPMSETEESLTLQRCEHDMLQLDCDECRYELGVVKVPESVEGELIGRIVVAAPTEHEQTLSLQCEVQADEQRTVRVPAPLDGRIHEVRVVLGQKVSNGQVLATLDSSAFVEVHKSHMAAHHAVEATTARLERLDRQQKDLKTLLQRLRESQLTTSMAEAVPDDLVVGEDRARVTVAFGNLRTATQSWSRLHRLIEDTRQLIAFLEGRAPQTRLDDLQGGEWKEALLTSRADLKLAKKRFERVRALVDKGVSSREELEAGRRELEVARLRYQNGLQAVALALDEAESRGLNELNAAQASYEAAVEEVELRLGVERLEAEQAVERARFEAGRLHQRLVWLGVPPDQLEAREAGESLDLSVMEIRSPASGLLVSQEVRPGQTVQEGDSLWTVSDPSVRWVWCNVYEGDLPLVRSLQAGTQALISVASLPGVVFAGKVDYLADQMMEDTRTVRLRIVTGNPSGQLWPGMFAQAVIRLGESSAHVVVPLAAVMSDEGKRFVFKAWRDGFWKREDVTLGNEVAGGLEVLSGVEPGDILAGDGAFLLKSDVLRSKMGAGCAD